MSLSFDRSYQLSRSTFTIELLFEATHVAAAAVDLSLFVRVIIYQSFFYSKQFVAASLPMDISCKFNLAYNCCHQKKNYLKRKIDCDTENNLTDVAI